MSTTPQKTQLEVINIEIANELKSPETAKQLLTTTFKGLNEQSMKQAILEGMIRGFTFKDFLQKNVYAIPFGQAYSLVTSIEHARKLGARGGVNGKSAPTYVEDESGNIISCSVTVFKKGGHEGGYTATVYFKEYSTGKNLWVSKPRTMIAKVAEMHALRMACPEEMQQIYVSEEMEQQPKGDIIDLDVLEELNAIKTIDELKKYYQENKGRGAAFAKMVTKRKEEISNEAA